MVRNKKSQLRSHKRKHDAAKKHETRKVITHRGGYEIQDKYFLEAKNQNYRARSVFKLLQINKKFNVIKPGRPILDVASAPGSFLQALHRICGKDTPIIGFDLLKMEAFGQSNIHIFQGDIYEHEKVRDTIQGILEGLDSPYADKDRPFELITSDIAPRTTGTRDIDQYESVKLNLAILDLAKVFLHANGTLILKVFVGEDIDDLISDLKKHFKTVKRTKPEAVRKSSFEEYCVCLGFRK